jgi:hypothetical protein
LNSPYSIDHENYERCNGEIVLQGVHYNYVKRLVQNDTMYLYCIPNQQKTALSNAKTEYAKQNSDNQQGKRSEQPSSKKINSLSEFNDRTLSFNFDTHNSVFNQTIAFNNCTILKGFTTQPSQPPDLFI